MEYRYRYLELFRNFLKEHDAYEDWILSVECSFLVATPLVDVNPRNYISDTFIWPFNITTTSYGGWDRLNNYWRSILDNEVSNGR